VSVQFYMNNSKRFQVYFLYLICLWIQMAATFVVMLPQLRWWQEVPSVRPLAPISSLFVWW